jgi:hypothetical protein
MKSLLAILLLVSINAISQSQAGVVLNANDRSPVAYAKIGVIGKGIGTVADENGNYALVISNKYGKDKIRFSCIGYKPYDISVADYNHMDNKTILLDERPAATTPVLQAADNAKTKTYGSFGTNDVIEINGGLPGSEVGLVFNFKETSLLNKLTLKVQSCTVDTIFYRVNVYNVTGERKFEMLLTKPIYYKMAAADLVNKTISIDLSNENVIVNGSKLITIEQLRNFGNGVLRFKGIKNGKSYGRKASFGIWKVIPNTISMQVEAIPVK